MAMDTEEIRAFLALPLSVFEQDIRPLVSKLKAKYPDVKWVNPAQIHSTLHFFGTIDQSRITTIFNCTTSVTQETKPFTLSLEGIGAFPNLEKFRVIWVGIRGEIERLNLLHALLEKNFINAGFECETREFKAHLTLGRIRDGKRVGPVSEVEFHSSAMHKVSEIILYKSKLTPQGPIYEKIHTFALSKT